MALPASFPITPTLFTVIPAKAGTHLLPAQQASRVGRWAPAFAGVTAYDFVAGVEA